MTSANGWHTLSMAALVRRLAAAHPGHLAVRDHRRSVTYADLNARTDALAGALVAAGVEPGDCVAALMVNGVDLVELLFAAAKARIVMLPLNWRLAGAELDYILSDARPKIVFASDELVPLMRSLRPANYRQLVIGDTPASDYDSWASRGAGAPLPCVEPEDRWIMLYTSGTTGLPKGCQLDQKGQVLAAFALQTAWAAGPADRLGCALPLFHIGGLGILFAHMVNAAGVVLAPRAFTAAQALPFLIDNRCTTAAIPLPFLEVMAEQNRRHTPPLKLRRLAMGGGMHEVAQLIAMRDAFDTELVCGYGQTEAGAFIAWNMTADQIDRPRSCGRAAAHLDVRIVDDAGNAVQAGEGGELCVRGPSVMAGYLNQPDATAEALRHGWLHTGDLFSVDAEGLMTMLGRKKELIKTGGENVYPREVEGALLSHPDVVEVAVFGVPHATWGEAVKAVVALRAGVAPDVEALMQWCRRSIARYKCPRFIEFLPELPHADTGKLLMRELRARPTTALQSTDARRP